MGSNFDRVSRNGHSVVTGPLTNRWAADIVGLYKQYRIHREMVIVQAAFRLSGKSRPKISWTMQEDIAGWVSASPWIIGFLLFMLGPMLFSMAMSFKRYDMFNPPQGRGFEDNPYCRLGELAKGSEQLIRRLVRQASEIGRPAAAPAEAYTILGMSG